MILVLNNSIVPIAKGITFRRAQKCGKTCFVFLREPKLGYFFNKVYR